MRTVGQGVAWLALAAFVPLPSAGMSNEKPKDRLDSWKAIANYLGKSVRTARRWEAEEGLPVHRQMHKAQGSAYAYRSEIDAWRQHMAAPAPTTAKPEASLPAPAGPAGDPGRSVAVLPFSYLGRDERNAYIADGFTAEIITGLSRIRSLRVISWTSSMTLKGRTRSAREVGSELGVERIVEGTVQHEGAQIRVSARLVNVHSDDRLWSNAYAGELDNLFAIQERLAREVASFLDLSAPAAPGGRLTDQPMVDVTAWRCLVQARQAALRWQRGSIDRAVELLIQGISLAPDDARLHAALGRTWLHYREVGADLSERPLIEARACAARAFTLHPGLAAGHQLAGWIHYAEADIQAAVRALKTALAAEPWEPDTLSLLANCYLISGRPAEAAPLIEQLVSIDPLTPLTHCMPGWAAAINGDFAAAVGPYRDMFTMDPANPLARLFLVYILAAAGRREEAWRVAVETPAATRDSLPGRLLSLFAHGLDPTGAAPAPEIDSRLLAQGTEVLPRFLAQAYALAGAASEAVKWTSVAADRGFINYPFLARHDPFLSKLAGTPAYDDLLERVKASWKRFEP